MDSAVIADGRHSARVNRARRLQQEWDRTQEDLAEVATQLRKPNRLRRWS